MFHSFEILIFENSSLQQTAKLLVLKREVNPECA